MSVEEKIEIFWSWFAMNESKLSFAIEHESGAETLVEDLNNLILDLGAFSWEAGPGMNKTCFLTISPNENKALLDVSKSIMDAAPNLENWQFNYFKPAKNWDRKFVIYDDLMNELDIDASSWKYVVLKFEGDMKEVIIEADNISHLDRETAQSAADLVIMSEVGEEIKINKISTVNIVNELDEQYVSNKSELKYLRDDLLDF